MTAAAQETFLQRRLRLKAERDAISAPSSFPSSTGPVANDNPRAQRWIAVKLEAQLSDLARMPPDSGRNHALNAIAYSCGRLIPKWLDEQDISNQLYAAARTCGLEHAESVATIRSGLAGGQQDPRDPPISDTDDGLAGLVHGPVATRRTAQRIDVTLTPGIDHDPAPAGIVEAARHWTGSSTAG